MKNSTSVSEHFATWQEVTDAFNSLKKEEIARLVSFSRSLVRFSPNRNSDWKDLFNEAINLALAGASGLEEDASNGRRIAQRGERRWKTSVPFVKFLMGVMKSVRSNEYRRLERRGGTPSTLNEEVLNCSAQDRASAKEDCDAISAFFRDDSDAMKVLEGLRLELTRDEIQRTLLGTLPESPKYDSVMRRIRRRVSRAQDR